VFFGNWAYNVPYQLEHFFGISSLDDKYLLYFLSMALIPIVICIGIIIANATYTVLHYKDEILNEKIANKGLSICFNPFSKQFWLLVKTNYRIEADKESEKTFLRLIILFFLVPTVLIKGNPILKNYYGTEFEDIKYDIVPKEDVKELIRSTIRDVFENEKGVAVKTRGYLFIQAGLFDGYYSFGYEGFAAYLNCIPFAILEKLIWSIMYFLIPFIIIHLLLERYG